MGFSYHRAQTNAIPTEDEEKNTIGPAYQVTLPPVVPAYFHPAGSKCATTYVEDMTADQTANWIWTIGKHYNWPKAEQYYETFRDNDICGNQLKIVTLEMLASDLKITKLHAIVIRNRIKECFPNVEKRPDRRVPHTGLHLPGSQRGSSHGGRRLPSDCSMSQYSGATTMSESTATTVGMPDSSSVRSTWRKLLLTLSSKDLPVPKTQIEQYLKSKFLKYDYHVEVSRTKMPNKYVVAFENEDLARHALAHQTTVGFHMVKKRPHRPQPKKPVWFRAKSDLIVREGKSMNGRVLGTLYKGDEVEVEQVKGRRARVRYRFLHSTHKGWVSIHTDDGATLLDRLES